MAIKVRCLMIALGWLCLSLNAFALTEEEKQAKAENLKEYLYNAQYTSEITLVKVTDTQVIISGQCGGEGQFALADFSPADDLPINNSNSIIASERLTENLPAGTFTQTLNRFITRDGYTYDRLLSRWAIVKMNNSEAQLASHARYADEVPALSSPDRLVPANKKGVGAGLGDVYMQDLVALDAKNITCNWVLPGFIALSPIWGANSYEYTYCGQKYYIDAGQIGAWDYMLRFYEEHGIAVSAILLITPNSSDDALSAVFRHPDYNAGYYSMPNMTNMQSVNAYAAIINFLANRYNGSGNGRVEHWIMHNEVDMGTEWTNMGSQPELVYIDEYIKSMRLCYNIVRQYDQNASVLGSYTHSWTYGANDYATKTMLEQTVRYSEVEGDFWWGVAHHPYPQNLTKPKFWVDDTQSTNMADSKYVTFKNLEVINEWILNPAHMYKGEKKRPLFLSENGTNSPSYSETDLANQAAGGCWAWKKTNELDGIDAIMWHNWMDNRAEFGLCIGLHFYPDDETNPGGNKPVWYVWQAAGTDREDEVMDPYKTLIGIEDWRDIFMLAQGEGRDMQAGKCFIIEAEDYDEGAYSARQTSTGDYRTDSENVAFFQGASYSGGWGLLDMGADWSAYTLNKWVDASTKTISREMAQENWGCWFEYTFNVLEPIEANVYVHHGAAWNNWGVAAGAGYAPGTDSYQIQGEPSLNWAKQYAGAMVMSLDGTNVATTQVARPLAPETFQARGTNFNKVLTKPENWTSTLTNGALQTDTLWLWPLAGGNNTSSAYYNDTPDYKNLQLSKGTHTLRITSICSPWNFDCLRFDCYATTGITNVTTSANKGWLKAWCNNGTLCVESDSPVCVYNLQGQTAGGCAATTAGDIFSSEIKLPKGIYIVRNATQARKIIVK